MPLFLFCDGYEVHRRSEYYACLWCSGASRTGSSYDSVFPIAVIRHACMPTAQIKRMMRAGLTRDGGPLTDDGCRGFASPGHRGGRRRRE
eukprot:9501720-Pyramimonas_sp.AAC.2